MQPFQSPPSYIDRDEQKRLLRQLLREVAAEPRPAALYIKAGGGLGKTHLFRQLPAILRDQWGDEPPLPYVAQPLDLYNFELRNPTIIEQQLIRGLTATAPEQWYRLTPDEAAAAFAPYFAQHDMYRQARYFGKPEAAEQAREQLRASFVACINAVAALRPLVIGFDTLETLFATAAPPQALVSIVDAGSGVDLVLDWMAQVLPRLQHTLVLFCGRPHPHEQQLIERLSALLPPEHIHELGELTDLADVRQYLAAYQAEPPPAQLLYVQQITENRPLLLTCYAQTHGSAGGLPRLGHPPRFESKAEFEDWLVSQILNPFREPASDEDGQRTLTLSLYFLVYARRGISRDQLRELFHRQQEPCVPAVIDRLDQVAIVKSDGERLFLHDEIFRLIDESGYADRYGAREATLDFLCEISADEVRRVQLPTVKLRAMTDHLYYELLRDLQRGYRVYTVYVDLLLRQRTLTSALVLCDAFWTIFAPLKERSSAPDPTLDEIFRDEAVRHVKYLRASDRPQEGAELAQQIHDRAVAAGLLPDDAADLAEHWPADPYCFVDLSIERAMAIAQSQSAGYLEEADRIFERVITLLEDQRTSANRDSFLFLRRQYFLGVAYTLRSYLLHQDRQYERAKEDGRRGRRAYLAYASDPVHDDQDAQSLLHDETLTDVAQASNNLAFTLALSGELDEARLRARDIVDDYGPHVSAYRRALFLNTYGSILLLAGLYLDARGPLARAREAADASGVRRVLGLVARSEALLARVEMISRQEPDPAIERRLEDARALLAGDTVARFDLLFDLAGFQRDIGAIYRARNELDTALAYEWRALATLEECDSLLTEGQVMQRADLQESMAAVHNNMEDYPGAAARLDEAEALMHRPMQRYGQVVAGKIALQRGLIAIRADHDFARGLQLLTIGFARSYLFADLHRDQVIFQRLIEQWIRLVPDLALHAFRTGLDDQPPVPAAALPYQQPGAEQWQTAWRKARDIICRRIDVRLDLA